MNKRECFQKIIFFISTITIVSLVIFCQFAGKYESTKFSVNENPYLVSDWTVDGEEVSLPLTFLSKRGDSVTLTTTLPQIEGEGISLMYRSVYCQSYVMVEGRKIGSYGQVSHLPFGQMVGNIRVLIPLYEEYSGKELSITFTCPYSMENEIATVLIGNKTDLEYFVLRNDLWRLFICTFLGFAAIACILIGFFQKIAGTKHDAVNMFLYLGAFILVVSVWIFASSDLPQFITNANDTVSLVSYLCLASMAIPFAGFCCETFKTGRKYFRTLEVLESVLPFVIAVLYVSKVMDPPEVVVITHFNMIVGILSAIFFSIKEWQTNKDSRRMILGMGVLTVAAICGLANYYISPTSGLDALFFGTGFTLFVLILLSLIYLHEMEFIRERLFMDFYKEMAYQDTLTTCGNRAAIEAAFQDAIEDKKLNFVSLYMIDLNRLKHINDEFGHEAGDEAIQATAECLKNAFGDAGKVYRLGGDEFAVVTWNKHNRVDFFRDKLAKQIDLYNNTHETPISMSVGVAESKWTRKPELFNTLYNQADEAMYEEKKTYHQNDGLDD